MVDRRMIDATPLWCYQPGDGDTGAGETTIPRERATDGGGKHLVCVKCGAAITTDGDRIEKDGRHEHDSVNPHGHGYHYGCFARAPGVMPIGEQSDHWSWFPGYRWQTAYCAGCGEHLGWMFLTNSDRFYGLILDRLEEAGDE
jgi:hypothetical protein